MAREEFHRLKKIKQKKKDKMKKHEHKKGHFCPICDKRTDKINIIVHKENPIIPLEAKKTTTESEKPILSQTIHLEKRTDSNKLLPPETFTIHPTTESDVNNKLNFIKKRITDIIAISKYFIDSGLDSIDINEFLNICEEAKVKIEEIFTKGQSPNQLDDNVKDQLKCLKCHLQDVIDVTKKFEEEGFVSSSNDRFSKVCKLDKNTVNEPHLKPDIKQKRSEIQDVETHIEDVIKMTQDYNAEGLLTPGVEEFLNSCNTIKAKLQGESTETKNIDEEKLDHLKNHVSELEELTIGIQDKNISSSSVKKFITACKEFKMKIDEDREKLQTRKTIQEISGYIDGTVTISNKALKEGLLGDSIEDFIKSIGDVKDQINEEQCTNISSQLPESNMLDALKLQINNIIKSVAGLKSGNLMSVSVDKFLESCEIAKAKIDLYQKYCPVDLEQKQIHPTCSERCICDHDNATATEESCDNCRNMDDDVPFIEVLPAPCDSCAGTVKGKTTSEICETCSMPIEDDILLPEPSPNISPEQSEVCEVCESHMAEEDNTKNEENTVTPVVDSSLGYFEKKVRKITKVKRTLNPDGTIREEKETITVRKERHDPTETSLLDEEENEEYDVSYESLLDNDDETQIAICSVPYQNQRGFLFFDNKAKSEIVVRVSPMTEPILKQCISYDVCGFRDHNLLPIDSFSIEIDFCSLYCNSNLIQHCQSATNE